jgi:Holliday junction resolvase RusA-like endonuclease
MKNLRDIFSRSSYTNYSYFIRNVVRPVVGSKGLHVIPSSGRGTEYGVSLRNLVKVCNRLGLPVPSEADPMRKVASDLLKRTSKSALLDLVTEAVRHNLKIYPLDFRINIHPFSINSQYEAFNGSLVSTSDYREWRDQMVELLKLVEAPEGLDLKGKMEVDLVFCHRPSFDTDNFIKSAIDALASHLKFNDKLIRVYTVKGVETNDDSDSYIRYRLRNL